MAPATDVLDATTDAETERTSSVRLRSGSVVAGAYRIVRHIGSGGSSHVFEVEHVRLGKRFAIKLLRPELDPNRRTAQRFRREARAIARIQSEHIVSVIDCGELEEGTPYLVMELLEGEDLRGLLNRERSLPVRRAVALIIEACQGLGAVHRAGLIHRDLKPENLFIARRDTGEDWCKVLDFGVAKMESSLSTAEDAIVGTARYMAPEQLTDSTGVSATTDVYALGAILYECLAGRPLVVGSTVQEVMYQIMNVEPAPLGQLVPTLPRTITDIVQRCVRKSPAARPASAEELAQLLRAAMVVRTSREADDTLAEDQARWRAPSPRKSRRVLLAAGAFATCLAAGLAGWYVRGTAPSRSVAPPSAAALATPARTLAPPEPVLNPVATAAGMGLANTPAVTPPISPIGQAARAQAPRPGTTAVPRRAVNRFDTTNPYAE